MKQIIKTNGLDDERLGAIAGHALKILGSLVESKGIYASNDGPWNGKYHHYFGRDTAITALFIFEAEKLTGKYQLSPIALQALMAMAKYQGRQNNPKTGEEKGKIPHEINTSQENINRLQAQAEASGGKLWYVDQKDHVLKNWDSVDSTPLWIIAICRYIQDGRQVTPEIYQKLVAAIWWCISNLEKSGGYSGWLPAEYQAGRESGGLTNQSWKDSRSAFLLDNGEIPNYPIHDVFSNAATWSALRHGADILRERDKKTSKAAAKAAKQLKRRFNKIRHGFRLKGSIYYAEALDAQLQQLTTSSIDVGMALSMSFGKETIFYTKYLKNIVAKLMSDEFYNEELGLRTYTQNIKNYSLNDQYHRGPQTFWPFTGALVALGLGTIGRQMDAEKVLRSQLSGLNQFDSFVELYQLKDGKAGLWHDTGSKQTSTLNQAWTAAAAYWASNYLVANR